MPPNNNLAVAYRYDLYVGESTPEEVADTLPTFDVTEATIQPATGLWQGKVEQTTVVSILVDEPCNEKMALVAHGLASRFVQHAVLLTRTVMWAGQVKL